MADQVVPSFHLLTETSKTIYRNWTNFVEILENKGLQKPSQQLIKKNPPLRVGNLCSICTDPYLTLFPTQPESAKQTLLTNYCVKFVLTYLGDTWRTEARHSSLN